MAVDASKLRKRRSLGVPPTEGAAGIEDATPPSAVPPPAPEPQDASMAALEMPQPGPQAEADIEPVAARRPPPPAARTRREAGMSPRPRVPPPEAEPRVPFTARITLSTKERLEDACYHLRRKHQDFVNEAILLHLRKHGF